MQVPDTDAPGPQPAGHDHGEPLVHTVSARRDHTPLRAGSPAWPRLSRPRSGAPSPSRPADAVSLPAVAVPVREHASPDPVDLPPHSTSTSRRRHLSTSPTLAPSHASSRSQNAKGHVPIPRGGPREQEGSSDSDEDDHPVHYDNAHRAPAPAAAPAHAGWSSRALRQCSLKEARGSSPSRAQALSLVPGSLSGFSPLITS